MKKKQSIVSAFSYPVRKAALIEEVSEKADKEGLSLSNLIVILLEEYNQKNEEARPDLSPLRSLSGRSNIDMGVNEDLRKYIPDIEKLEDIHELKELNITAQDISRITGTKLGQLLKLNDNDVQRQNKVLPFSYDRSKLNL
jgi:hypothetical protein